jgi:hypothetical protein
MFATLADGWVIVRTRAGEALRWTRRARGWKVETEFGFNVQVKLAARMVEEHPHVREIWKLGRTARIHAVNAVMYDLLARAVGPSITIDCMTDGAGALGEVSFGLWVKPFRIELDRRRRKTDAQVP